jgi:uncharacterized membrane protein YbaN (DUF454 family)
MKKVLREISGWSFILLGIAGLFLPVLPGVLFLLVGFALLSVNHHWARHWLRKLGDRYPRGREKLRQFLGTHARHIPGLDPQPNKFADEA